MYSKFILLLSGFGMLMSVEAQNIGKEEFEHHLEKGIAYRDSNQFQPAIQHLFVPDIFDLDDSSRFRLNEARNATFEKWQQFKDSLLLDSREKENLMYWVSVAGLTEMDIKNGAIAMAMAEIWHVKKSIERFNDELNEEGEEPVFIPKSINLAFANAAVHYHIHDNIGVDGGEILDLYASDADNHLTISTIDAKVQTVSLDERAMATSFLSADKRYYYQIAASENKHLLAIKKNGFTVITEKGIRQDIRQEGRQLFAGEWINDQLFVLAVENEIQLWDIADLTAHRRILTTADAPFKSLSLSDNKNYILAHTPHVVYRLEINENGSLVESKSFQEDFIFDALYIERTGKIAISCLLKGVIEWDGITPTKISNPIEPIIALSLMENKSSYLLISKRGVLAWSSMGEYHSLDPAFVSRDLQTHPVFSSNINGDLAIALRDQVFFPRSTHLKPLSMNKDEVSLLKYITLKNKTYLLVGTEQGRILLRSSDNQELVFDTHLKSAVNSAFVDDSGERIFILLDNRKLISIVLPDHAQYLLSQKSPALLGKDEKAFKNEMLKKIGL